MWRGRPGSQNIEDRRGQPEKPARFEAARRWWNYWFAKPDHDALDEDNEASLDRYISRKDRE